MRFWYSKPHHLAKIREFEELVHDFALEVTWPNAEKAPWHVQARVGHFAMYPQTINFWPHLMKAHWCGEGSIAVGGKEIAGLIERATMEAYAAQPLLMEEEDAETVS